MNWLKPFIAELRQQQGINRLQGSSDANILLVAPLPGEDELKENLCWCSREAVWFFDTVATQTGLKPDDFLIVPTTFDGGKPVKANTQLIKDILTAAANGSTITHFVCMGGVPFKPYFGYGAKPPASVLTGSIIKTRETGHKPLFTFPDPTGLLMKDGRYPTGREYYQAKFISEKLQGTYMQLMEKFKKFTGKNV